MNPPPNVWWRRLGVVLYWLTWPGTWLILQGSRRAYVLIICGDYVVVTRSWLSNGKWLLPGGGLHKGENSLDAVLRELYEETELRLQPEQVQRYAEQIFQKGPLRFNYVLFASVVKRKSNPRPRPPEIIEARWLRRQELTAANAAPNVLSALDSWWESK